MPKCENCFHYHMCDLQYRLEEHQDCKHYKDKSLIVELPCKVGDKTYYLNTRLHISLYQNYVYEATVVRIVITEKFITIVFQIRDENGCTETVAEEKDIGKTVFFTREEAEKKLKESKR